MNRPELLAPAGNFEKLKTAIDFGADAVYVGGSKLNLRAFADNFSDDELREAIKYVHDRNKKIYVTLNVFPHNDDLNGLEEYLITLYEAGVDAVIVADPGIIMTAREIVPNLELHLSTQANNVNYKAAQFWYKQGVKRIVLARELSFKEIEGITNNLSEDCDIEAFVHGAMCVSYSGRCLISNYMVGRDSNRGACAQPCRYKYYLVEEKRPNEFFRIIEDDKGTYLMNSKDLCMIEHIPELMKSGITSFKVEGRMKSPFYVAMVIKTYRAAIDAYLENPEGYEFKKEWLENLQKISHRKYHTGFYFGRSNDQIYEDSAYIRNYDIVGVVRSYDIETKTAVIEQRNRVFQGDEVEVLRPFTDEFKITLNDMYNEKNEKIEVAPSAQMIFSIKCEIELKVNDLLYMKK
jgi:putative protease